MSILAAWGRWVHRHPWVAIVLSVVLLGVSGAGLVLGGTLINTPPQGTESDRGFDLMEAQLPAGGPGFTLVFSSDTLNVGDAAFRQALEAAIRPLESNPLVTSLAMPYGDQADADRLASQDGRHALVVVSLTGTFPERVSDYELLRDAVASDVLDVHATGGVAVQHDFDRTLEADLQRAEVVSLPATLLLLLLVFGAAVAALLPLGVGVLSVVGGIGTVFFLAKFTDVSQYALNITTLIGLAVAIDYSLFVVTRFREQLAAGDDVETAIARTLETAGRAVIFSGVTVAVGLSGLLFFQGSFLASMGLAGTIVVMFAVFYALTLLPALLSLLGARVDKGRFFHRSAARPSGQGPWHAIAINVMRRPWPVLLVTLGIVGVAVVPFAGIQLASGGIEMLPADAETRQGLDIIDAAFPGRDDNRILVVVSFTDGRPLSQQHVGAVFDLSRQIAGVDGVDHVDSIVDLDPRSTKADYQSLYAAPASTRPPPVNELVESTVGEGIVLLSVLTPLGDQSEGARELVRALRGLDVAGGEVLVTGQTAFDLDMVDFIVAGTPAAILWVVSVTFVLLLLLTGSLVLPVKALAMNFLSISASFGALVFIFQQGHFADFLGFTPAPIDPVLPIIMFCIVFGLSMDYEVFMLSRMHEEYQRLGDNTLAVAEGLERTGRLITGGAAIMVVVFAAFGLAEVTIIKAIGIGLAIAIFLDATLVRALLVPSTMRLMGKWNWWAPRAIAKLRIGGGH